MVSSPLNRIATPFENDVNMSNEQYSAVPLDEGGEVGGLTRKGTFVREIIKKVLFLSAFAAICFVLGFGVGQNWTSIERLKSWPKPEKSTLLPPQSFIPESMVNFLCLNRN